MTTVELSPAARRELLDAQAFYAAVTPTLMSGSRRRSTHPCDASLRRQRLGRLCRRMRRYVVSVFPYAILYRVENGNVLVTAIAHQRRRFGYWRGR